MNAPDLTRTAPRSGREMLGGYAWLARLADKARAEAAGTEGEYVAYCPLSNGFLRALGVSPSAFDERIRAGASDDELAHWLDGRVDPARKEEANRFILDEMRDHLDEQDAEEGRAA